MSNSIETHSNNLAAMSNVINELMQDHQRLAKDSTHDLTRGIQLYMQVITTLQKTILSFEEVKKEMTPTKDNNVQT